MKKVDISIVLTSFNDTNIERILVDIASANFKGLEIEIIILEAGLNNQNLVKNRLGSVQEKLIYLHKPKLNRTSALNLLFEKAVGIYVCRLDSRTHIYKNYFQDLFEQAKKMNVENIGGVIEPVGNNAKQKLIAKIMQSKFCFGGGKFREENFQGFCESVYLGFFLNSFLKKNKITFDENPKISEDSDINYQIRKNGGKVYCDSRINVKYFAREKFLSFFKMIFNYGYGRGLFIQKNKSFRVRQIAPPSLLVILFLLLIFSFFSILSFYLLLIVVLTYSLMNLFFVYKLKLNISSSLLAFFCFVCIHFYWSVGLILSCEYLIQKKN